jgi:hypothetical protein
VRVSATFDPPIVKPGERSVYRVAFSALEDSIDWPENLAMPKGVEARAGARGQILQMAGPSMEPRSGFNYHVRSRTPGIFTIPEFKVNVYGKPVVVPAARLEVRDARVATVSETPHLVVELSRTNVFVGQAFKVRVKMPGTYGTVQILSQVQFAGQGILADQSAARQSLEADPASPGNRVSYVYETLLTPIASGNLSFIAQGWSAPNRATPPAIVNGVLVAGTLDYVLLDSDSAALHVNPLPIEGRLPGFTGAVGKLSVESPVLSTNVVRIGEAIRLTVNIKGEGNISRLVPPPPPTVPEWRVFASQPDRPMPQMIHPVGNITLTYVLIPLTASARQTPAIPFCYFDPDARRFVDASIPGLAVKVTPGKGPEVLPSLLEAQALVPDGEREPVMHGIARSQGTTTASLIPLQQRLWFPAVQAAPALAFFLLWSWDRRRRYLEANPGIILRRRARSELRRRRKALRKAVTRHDESRFVESAVKALQAACAPHYPAEARALVGADVLEVMDPVHRSGPEGQVVRRVFEIHDKVLFNNAALEPDGILGMEAGLLQALETLERKLSV